MGEFRVAGPLIFRLASGLDKSTCKKSILQKRARARQQRHEQSRRNATLFGAGNSIPQAQSTLLALWIFKLHHYWNKTNTALKLGRIGSVRVEKFPTAVTQPASEQPVSGDRCRYSLKV